MTAEKSICWKVAMASVFAVFVPLICVIFSMCCGCTSKKEANPFTEWSSNDSKLKVLSTTAMIDDLVGEIGKERVIHIALINGEIDPHSYELVKGDDEKFGLSHLFFYNGLGLEHGASVRYQIQTHPYAVDLGAAILHRVPDRIIYVGKEVDPHLWMDVSLWMEGVDVIADVLAMKDPEGKDVYRTNAAILKEKMGAIHEKIKQQLQRISPEKRYLVTSHDAFNYFTRAYLALEEETLQEKWRFRFDAPEGLAPDGQLSVTNIQHVVDHLMHYHIHVIFPESNVSQDSLKKIQQVCEKKNFEVKVALRSLYGDAMGPKESGAGSYLEMMQYNTEVLLDAWR